MAVAERELTTPAQGAEGEWTPQPYRWTREQFYELGEAGLFDGRRVILMEGEILVMPAMKPPHQTAVSLAAEAARVAFGAGFFVREQGPFDVRAATDLEPDIAVVAGSIRDFADGHPTEAALVIEVSDATLAYDRREKASMYAKAGVADYWVVNLRARQVEIHRLPAPDEAQPYGFGYSEVTVYQSGKILQPLAAPQPVAVSLLLP